MTAIANTTITDTQYLLFSVANIEAGPGSDAYFPSNIFCTGALTNPDGQFLYLSLIGRDTALQELRGRMSAGKLSSFLIRQDGKQLGSGKQVGSGWFSREWLGQMQYHGSKIPTDLFGELSLMVLYHPLMTTPDKSNQTAALPFMGGGQDQCYYDLWNVVRNISEVPLLDTWRDVVMAMLTPLGWMKPLVGFNCNALYAKLGSEMSAIISANVRSGALCADGSAHMGKLTLDPDYGRTPPEPVPSEPPQGGDGGDGFWDDAEVMHTYPRAQAIEDGDLVDVSDTSEAHEAGFRVPVALTRAVWNRFVEWDNDEVAAVQRRLGQSTAGRLWDVLYMARYGISIAPKNQGGTLLYELYAIPRDGRSVNARKINLKLHSGGGDNGEHVITIMLPDED
ncbi:MAG: hypothetical protein PHE17_17610 [Thiothrix sp.]|uniref:DUF6573 family protein n=1 Tax=Thiothrix sp. TaxID=1032 RepID=UPI00261CBE88|nr:DUF6573 family protein [Thiothrix sp.]MDD5394838.1 hypothetical protein [Thiothrix sp.]